MSNLPSLKLAYPTPSKLTFFSQLMAIPFFQMFRLLKLFFFIPLTPHIQSIQTPCCLHLHNIQNQTIFHFPCYHLGAKHHRLLFRLQFPFFLFNWPGTLTSLLFLKHTRQLLLPGASELAGLSAVHNTLLPDMANSILPLCPLCVCPHVTFLTILLNISNNLFLLPASFTPGTPDYPYPTLLFIFPILLFISKILSNLLIRYVYVLMSLFSCLISEDRYLDFVCWYAQSS